jgi:general secretion pathway protein G
MYVNRPVRRAKRRSGFTLLELLIVLAIIGVLAAMVVPQLLGRQKEANVKITRTSIKGLEDALKLYAVDHDAAFPEGGQEALNLLLNPTDKYGKPMSAYLERAPLDAWGQALFYEFPNTKAATSAAVERPAIWSSGPNRKNDNGTGDDVNNWDEAVVVQ